ncbi:MAG: glutaminase A [Acidobacteriota bacterium]
MKENIRLNPISLPTTPVRTHLMALLNELYEKYRLVKDGEIASYIPELAKAKPDWFAIAIATVDGQIYEVGDCQQLFTLQSLSKPFVYGLALEDHGHEYISTKVGVEPTGEAFNSIMLDERSKRPHNPMINAGAIAMASVIKGDDPTERLNHMLEMFSRYIGEEVFVNMSVFMSERLTGHRNRAIAHLMRNFGMLNADIDTTLDLYFQQCSVMVNCSQLALMAATLANNGINPITNQSAVMADYVKDILSLMYTCGLYDSAGEWAYRIGLPAKSGVGGGIFAVIPQQFGIAIFSPPLDPHGHSVRGIKVCEEFSQRFKLHLFDLVMGCSKIDEIMATK